MSNLASPQRHARLRRLELCAGLGLSAGVGGGCARSNVTTTIKPDDTWTRTLQFHGAAGDSGMTAGPKVDDVFVLPAGAP